MPRFASSGISDQNLTALPFPGAKNDRLFRANCRGRRGRTATMASRLETRSSRSHRLPNERRRCHSHNGQCHSFLPAHGSKDTPLPPIRKVFSDNLTDLLRIQADLCILTQRCGDAETQKNQRVRKEPDRECEFRTRKVRMQNLRFEI